MQSDVDMQSNVGKQGHVHKNKVIYLIKSLLGIGVCNYCRQLSTILSILLYSNVDMQSDIDMQSK